MPRAVVTIENINNVAKTYFRISTLKKILTFTFIGYALFKVIQIFLKK